MYCKALTDQEVRSCIKFSGMFGDKTHANTAPIKELRQQLEWLRKTHPQCIQEHVHSKLNSTTVYLYFIIGSIILVLGMILLNYIIMLINVYRYVFLYIGLFILSFNLLYSLDIKLPRIQEPPRIQVTEKKYKKKYIPSTLKRLVWNAYIGEHIGKSTCVCCQVTHITQLSFHCGHVIAEVNGGETHINNLRPICQNCNSSMGTTNMYDFMNAFSYNIVSER